MNWMYGDQNGNMTGPPGARCFPCISKQGSANRFVTFYYSTDINVTTLVTFSFIAVKKVTDHVTFTFISGKDVTLLECLSNSYKKSPSIWKGFI